MADQDLTDVMNRIKAVAQSDAISADTEEHKQSYDAFINKLIDERGFPDLTPEVKEELKKDLVTRLDSFIAAKVIAALSDADVLVFEQMLKDNKPSAELQQFSIDHIANFTDFLTNTLLEFRGVYLGLISVPVSLDVNLTKRPMPPAPLSPAKSN